ncbi:MAG TPA: hypothetical protein VG028_08960 [Terriglobia bacterium]|nr:hypothetical protein [Terriglobia bacterium]
MKITRSGQVQEFDVTPGEPGAAGKQMIESGDMGNALQTPAPSFPRSVPTGVTGKAGIQRRARFAGMNGLARFILKEMTPPPAGPLAGRVYICAYLW